MLILIDSISELFFWQQVDTNNRITALKLRYFVMTNKGAIRVNFLVEPNQAPFLVKTLQSTKIFLLIHPKKGHLNY